MSTRCTLATAAALAALLSAARAYGTAADADVHVRTAGESEGEGESSGRSDSRPDSQTDAQDPETTGTDEVELTLVVTSVAGASVFVDGGRDDGLEPGDRVRFEPPGRSTVIGEVRSVSSATARVELLDPEASIDVGESGTARIPRGRWLAARSDDVPPAADTSNDNVPEHPPWTHPPESWSSDDPLLAPPRALAPSERDVTSRGRIFLQGDQTEDRETEPTTSRFWRVGVDAGWTNLWGHGGTFEVDTEVVVRSFETEVDSESDARLRFQRLSYAIGGDRGRPTRIQAGRFLQRGFVEFGLLDGVEVSRVVSGGSKAWSVGGSVGFMPAPTFDLATGRDAQIALFARRTSLDRTGLSYGFGLQKTFHDGAADRDLLVADLDWRPFEQFAVHGSASIDWYTSGERAVDEGPQLTELHVFGNWTPSPRGGASLSFDRTRSVDTDREPFDQIDAEIVREQLFKRMGLRVWRRVTPGLLLSARTDFWKNQDDSGGGGEVRGVWTDGPWERSRLAASLFVNDGTFTSVQGLRASLGQRTDVGRFELGWEIVESEQDGAVLGDPNTTEQSVRASWDHGYGRLATSLWAEHFFGDARAATSFGFFFQWRL